VPASSTALIRVLLYLLEFAAKPVSRLKLAALAMVKFSMNTNEIKSVRKCIVLKLKLIRGAVYFTLFILKEKKSLVFQAFFS
jgi:signal transduction protein with GAF and PtsI domain